MPAWLRRDHGARDSTSYNPFFVHNRCIRLYHICSHPPAGHNVCPQATPAAVMHMHHPAQWMILPQQPRVPRSHAIDEVVGTDSETHATCLYGFLFMHVSSHRVVTMLSGVHAIVSAIEENKNDITSIVSELRASLQQYTPEARESWNSACLLWHAIVQMADGICARANQPPRNETAAALRCFTCDQWQSVYQLAFDLLGWSTDKGQRQTAGPPAIHAMKVQLQLFDAEVDALGSSLVYSAFEKE